MNTTIENNKLLAEFMGEKLPYTNKEGNFEFVVEGAGKVSSPNEEDLYRFLPYKYNTDWNWLMQVVEKIESLENHGFTIYRKTTNINGLPIELANTIKGTKIESVYNACVEFVKWYSAQEK